MRKINIRNNTNSRDNNTMTTYIAHSRTKLEPIIKWAGGKESELKYIIPNLPKSFDTFFEPFVGGGSVFTAIKATSYKINDKSKELINLYNCIKGLEKKDFLNSTEEVIFGWDFISKLIDNNRSVIILKYKLFRANSLTLEQLTNFVISLISDNYKTFNDMLSKNFISYDSLLVNEINKSIVNKLKRVSKIETTKNELPDNDIISNIECAIKSGYYTHIRTIYNHKIKYIKSKGAEAAIFFFIRNLAYGGMFRYNASGEFNVPYGGIGYNRKDLRKKLNYYQNGQLEDLFNMTEINCLDFEVFLNKNRPTKNDFIFLDPPYDTEFSTYSQNTFDRNDQIRLSRYLINECRAKWMLIIKNNDFIIDLYSNNGLNISIFDKTYLVSFMNRNDKKCEHLIITNY